MGSTIFRSNRTAQRAQARHVARRRKLHRKIAKAEQQAPEWQAAAEVLTLVGEHGGDPMMAHIATLRTLTQQAFGKSCTASQAGQGVPDRSVGCRDPGNSGHCADRAFWSRLTLFRH